MAILVFDEYKIIKKINNNDVLIKSYNSIESRLQEKKILNTIKIIESKNNIENYEFLNFLKGSIYINSNQNINKENLEFLLNYFKNKIEEFEIEYDIFWNPILILTEQIHTSDIIDDPYTFYKKILKKHNISYSDC